MKILYFHQFFGTRAGTNGIRSYEMSRALIDAGHEVTMVCASFVGSTTGLTGPFVRGVRRGFVDGIEVIEFRLTYSNSDGVFARARKFLTYGLRAVLIALRRDFDVVFATSTPLTAGIPGIAAKVLRRKPFVFEVRDLWPELPKAMGMRNPLLLWLMKLLERSSYHAADRVIGLAPGIVDGIVRAGKNRRFVTLIPNGCDLHLFKAAPRAPASLWPDRILENDFVAIFAGAHGRANGLDAILAAARQLQDRNREHIKILLIGQGSEKARLQRNAADLGLTNVIFADPAPKSEIAALLKGSHAGLQVLADIPAFYEGTSPNKFFDYLAAGLPVLINYPGWLARLVVEEQCGVAVPPGDPAAFATALEQLADDPQIRNAMGQASRRLGSRMFNRAELADEFESVLLQAARADRAALPTRSTDMP